MNSRLSSMSFPMPQSPGPAFQGMIDTALQQANSKLASLKKAHHHLLQKYTELEIKHVELQAQHEMDAMRSPTSSSHMHSQYGDLSSDTESPHPQQHNGRSIHQYRKGQYQRSEDSMSPQSSFTDSPNPSNYSGMRDYMQSPSSLSGPTSPGNRPPKYSAAGHMSPEPVQRHEYYDNRPQLRRQHSVPDSIATATIGSGSAGTTISDDARSMRTVRSTTSSEKAAKIKPQSEVRIRGRGGKLSIR
jgi:solute carrier family 25 protein 16